MWRCGWIWNLQSLTPKEFHVEPEGLRKSFGVSAIPLPCINRVDQLL